jgi:hypothetical protein
MWVRDRGSLVFGRAVIRAVWWRRGTRCVGVCGCVFQCGWLWACVCLWCGCACGLGLGVSVVSQALDTERGVGCHGAVCLT